MQPAQAALSAAAVTGKSRFGPAAILMNIWAYPLMFLWTLAGIIFLFPLTFAVFKTFTRWRAGRIMRLLVWVYGRGWMAIMSPFVRFNREGFGEARLSPPGVIVVNHLSFFDTYFMALLPFHDVVFAVRAWPFKMPWYAPFMRLAEYLDVETLSYEESLEASRRLFSRGSFILFFPEGHRSRDGRLQRFHSGAFKIAIEAGVPLIPLCITGTNVLLGPGRFWLQPARVRLKALPPVDTSGFAGPGSHLSLRKLVKERMAQEIDV